MDDKSISEKTAEERTLLEGILRYLSILLAYKKLIIITTAVTTIGAVVFSVISLVLPPDKSPLPNYYMANAVILIQEETQAANPLATMFTAFGLTMPSGSGGISYSDLAQEVIQSRSFIDTVTSEFNFVEHYEITEKELTNSRLAFLTFLSLAYNVDTSSLSIRYEDTDPDFARDVANRVVELLDEWFDEWEGSSSQRQIRLIEEKLTEVSAAISELEQVIQDFHKEYGVLALDELAQSRSQMIADLQSQLIQLEIEIKNYSQFSTIEDASLTRLKTRRENLLQEISQIEQGYTGGEKNLPAQDELPSLALEFARLETDLEIQMRVYQTLSQQYEIAKITAGDASRFDILEYAESPEEKSRPSRSQICMFSAVLGFLGSVFAAVVINLIKDISKDPKKKAILMDGLKQ